MGVCALPGSTLCGGLLSAFVSISRWKVVMHVDDIVAQARNRLKSLGNGGDLRTGDVRKVSSALYRDLEDKSIDNVFALCERLLDEREWTLGILAYDWAYRVRRQYDSETFVIFERWLKEYVTGWGDCDDFCTHAFGELLAQNNELFTHVIEWTRDPNFCVRRASAVILIYPIRRNRYEGIDPFLISDALMHDSHHLVLQGYGWMLKVLSQVERDSVYEYLVRKKKIMPRTAFRYALEKFDEETRSRLMKD